MSEQEHFSRMAEQWNMDPQKLQQARNTAGFISEEIPLNRSMVCMEIGAGTGDLSILLSEKVGEITLIDTNADMIRVMKEKTGKTGCTNLRPVLADPSDGRLPRNRFDLVYAVMSLHHIKETDKLLGELHRSIKPGGFFLLIDLEKEDGSFHAHIPGFEGHNGFDRNELIRELEASGFIVETDRIINEIKKTDSSGRERIYPLFYIKAVNRSG